MTEKTKAHKKDSQAQSLAGLPKIEREPRFRVRVKTIDRAAEGIMALSLERPSHFSFEPGQYIWLVLPELSKIRGAVDRRAYTIVSSTDDQTVDLQIRMTDSQFVSKIKTLKSGQLVDIIGPMGVAFKGVPEHLHYDYGEIYPPGKIDEQLASMFEDVTGSKKKLLRKKKLPDIGSFFLQVTEQNRDHTILTDRNGRIIFANQAAKDATGYSFDEMRGQTPRLWGGLMPQPFYKKLWTSLQKGLAAKETLINRRRDGSLYVAIATITPIIYNETVTAFVATEENITGLYEIDKAKSEFVSVASHQLRTPLSVINWYTEALLSGGLGELDSKQKRYLQEIYESSQHMGELIESLLNISRLELGTFVAKSEPVNLTVIAKKEIAEQKVKAEEKAIKISLSADKKLPIIQADPGNLRIIIQNLLSNAIKYSPEGSRVDIRLSVHDKTKLLLEVEDNGYGIPVEQQDKIFSKMFRADNVQQKNIEGTGLGLYIVRSIIEGAGGKIWFKSKEGQGTTFYVMIPMRAKYKK